MSISDLDEQAKASDIYKRYKAVKDNLVATSKVLCDLRKSLVALDAWTNNATVDEKAFIDDNEKLAENVVKNNKPAPDAG